MAGGYRGCAQNEYVAGGRQEAAAGAFAGKLDYSQPLEKFISLILRHPPPRDFYADPIQNSGGLFLHGFHGGSRGRRIEFQINTDGGGGYQNLREQRE